MDDVRGPVFEAAHGTGRPRCERLIDVWAGQLLGEPGYDGQPLRAHEPVHERTPLSHSHDVRWVELFCDTIDASCPGPRAEIATGRGCTMAAAMERLLSGVAASGTAPIEPMWRRGDGACRDPQRRCSGRI